MKNLSNTIDYFGIGDKINDKKINDHIGHDLFQKERGRINN